MTKVGLFNAFGKSKEEKERELMKSLCFDIVVDFSQLLTERGCNKPINVLELIIFASFIVTETYSLAKLDLNKKNTQQLDRFHLDVLNQVIDEYVLKEQKIKDTGEILNFREEFYGLIESRYLEYRPAFRRDVADLLNNHHGAILFGFTTLNKFLSHLFVDMLTEAGKSHLIVPLSLKLVMIYTGFLQSFK